MLNIFKTIINLIFPISEMESKVNTITNEELNNPNIRCKNNINSNIQSVFIYKNPLIRELVWQIKYKKNNHALKCASYALYNEIIKNNSKAILVPIPISRQRRNERGYNQCELIINEIIKLDANNNFKKVFDLLIRNKNTTKQTFKDRNNRINDSKSIFSINEDLISDYISENIIIIDDVMTTGSTINSAIECLSNAGFENIKAITLAH